MSVWDRARAMPMIMGEDAWIGLPYLMRLIDEIDARPGSRAGGCGEGQTRNGRRGAPAHAPAERGARCQISRRRRRGLLFPPYREEISNPLMRRLGKCVAIALHRLRNISKLIATVRDQCLAQLSGLSIFAVTVAAPSNPSTPPSLLNNACPSAQLLKVEPTHALQRRSCKRLPQALLLAALLGVSTVSIVKAAETCTEHFSGCHATCVRRGSGADESCRHQCQRGLRRCLQTGCAHGACGLTQR